MSLRHDPSTSWTRPIAWVRGFLTLALVAVSGLALPGPVGAAECSHPYYWGPLSGYSPRGQNCLGAFMCYRAIAEDPYFALEDASCDPQTQGCVVQLRVPLEFPGVIDMIDDLGLGGSITPWIFWFDEPTAGSCGSGPFPPLCSPPEAVVCGTQGFGGKINTDFIETWVERGGITCDNAGSQTGDFAIRAVSCLTGGSCRRDRVVEGLTWDTPQLAMDIGCPPPPPPWDCGNNPNCTFCGPGGSGPAGGGPAGGAGGGPGGEGGPTGPGALLRYRAGGVGGPGYPGSTAWNTELGRNWSHDYAQRIVLDPDTGTDAHVWLLTSGGSFREFQGLAKGVYTQVSPSDEFRTLRRTTGWELDELDGMVHTFDASGRWTETIDRNGNTKTATYTSGQLTRVDFPDGRHEDFTYHPGGLLATITEVGVDGTSTLLWSYTWTGLDLTRIDRPDGTALAYTYDDVRHPGLVTRVELLPTSGTPRVVRGYAYDDAGNVVDTWKGSPTLGSAAVDHWSYAFDDPMQPQTTTVTDPLGGTTVYTVGRDTLSAKPRLEGVSGDCPSCGLDPNGQLTYNGTNPLRPDSMTDGEGNQTLYTYTAEGMVATKTEAVGTPRERTLEWTYDPNFPALVTEERRPSVLEDGLSERVTTWIRDPANGNPTTLRIQGFEDGVAFSYDTVIAYNDDADGGGRPTSIDPPGYGMNDVTSHTYDPGRGNGNLIVATSTETLLGVASQFGYDAFNRRTRSIDPNGVARDTRYDALDRVTHAIERSADGLPATPPDPPEPIVAADLVTESVFDAYGDLDRTILPEGNVIDLGYDAAGRLTSVERYHPSDLDARERILYTLDDIGNRIREDFQRWDSTLPPSGDWVTESFVLYHYDSRCHLGRIEEADGSITEYDYDCNGNLIQMWDANHPSSGQTAPATHVFGYDELDRLTTVTRPWTGAGGGSAVTTYDYDVQDHLVGVTDAEGNETAFLYSDRDLRTGEASRYLATGAGCGTFPDCSQNGCGCTRRTYDEHGKMLSSTDPRGKVATYTRDALDRVTSLDYADPDLDTTYVYDDPLVALSLGRMTRASRGSGSTVTFEYDRFGRTTRDGSTGFVYDENGNRARIEYLAGGLSVDAVYSHDFADRESTLTLEPSSGGTVPLVTAADYAPAGPLTQLTLANGVVETRTTDARYRTDRITAVAGASTLLDWDYTYDAVTNVVSIDDLVTPVNSRGYAYQDIHYYLTCAAGPWNPAGADCSTAPPGGTPLEWSYDRIGNRLSETRAGAATSYSYTGNGSGGNSPLLTAVGKEGFAYDAAGNLIGLGGDGTNLSLTVDDSGRLSEVTRKSPKTQLEIRYDARGLVGSTYMPPWRPSLQEFATGAIRDSNGMLWTVARQPDPSSIVDKTALHDIFYFAGRPVAVREKSWWDPVVPVVRYYTTDHLGTPVLVTDDAGAVVWEGGFEPFGDDYASAGSDEIFLRLPGQWEDESWKEATDGRIFENAHRWYQQRRGRYNRMDPLGAIRPGRETLFAANHAYTYAASMPTFFTDPSGLKVVIENPKIQKAYDDLKNCFPLFRLVAEHFENDTNFIGRDRVWSVKDPDFNPPACMVGGRRTETETIWVPPTRDCKGTMRCLLHEFYELWQIRVGGVNQFGPAGPADRQARAMEKNIPMAKCCPCGTSGSGAGGGSGPGNP